MRYHNLQSRDFSRRAFLVAMGQLAAFATVGGRLHYLQVKEGEKYRVLSDGNRIRLLPVIPKRGKITDRHGAVLAEGVRRYQLLLDLPPYRENDNDLKNSINIIKHLLDKTEEEIEKIRKEIDGKGTWEQVLLDDDLTWEEVAKIEEHTPDLPGAIIIMPEVRNYPLGAVTAHVLGYVGLPAKGDLPDSSPLLHHPDFRIGKSGMEKRKESFLAGVAGVRRMEVNARGAYVRELETKPGESGQDLSLTLDAELQQLAESLLKGRGGLKTEGASCVVMDIWSGDVLVMASVPGFDPNRFVRGISKDYWAQLTGDPDAPLANKAVAMQYPPGSTFKPVSALAALDSGLVDEHFSVFCPGYYELGGRRYHCWQKEGHGHVGMRLAIAQSCNVYFYSLARRIGVDRLAATASRLGLGALTGAGLPEEKPGLVPTPSWKKKALRRPWFAGETLNMVIGQGYTLATPIQLAVMTARIASGGRNIAPRLIMPGAAEPQLPAFDDLGFHPRHISIVQEGMDMVINSPEGASFRHHIDDPDFTFAGKTGTVQVIGNRGRPSSDIPEERAERHHAMFTGYGPVQQPRYALAVVVEHGGYGSAAAAPVAREIFLKLRERHKPLPEKPLP